MLLKLALTAIALASISRAESVLYLLSGTPTPSSWSTRYSLDLFKLENGAMVEVSSLVPGNIGSHWVAFAYDAGLAAIWATNDDITVIDLATGTVAKKCHLTAPGNSLMDQWLFDIPGRGLMLAGLLVTDDPARPFHRGMLLDPKVSCDESFPPAIAQDLHSLVAHGVAGIGGTHYFDGIKASETRLDDEGNFKMITGNVPLGLQLPAGEIQKLKKAERPMAGVFAINSKLKVISLTLDGHRPLQYYALRKRDNTWHKLPAVTQSTAFLRTFGSYIAIAESFPRPPKAEQQKRNQSTDPVPPKSEPTEVTPGNSEWRTKSVARGPDTFTVFDASRDIFPGRLHLFDVETDRLYTIKTNQGDSEILLVEDNTVYYRVTTRLYSAPIAESGIGPATLLVTDEAVRDAHWAFLTR